MVLDFPMAFCKSLLKDEKNVLEELKKYATYEIAIGHNGKQGFFGDLYNNFSSQDLGEFNIIEEYHVNFEYHS